MAETILAVRFRLTCDASFGGPVPRRLWSDLSEPPPLGHGLTARWPGYDAGQAPGRRLQLAASVHGFALDPRRCKLTPQRLVLAGTAAFRGARHGGDAVASLVSMMGWTLNAVYGHTSPLLGITDAPMPGLSIYVAEERRPRR